MTGNKPVKRRANGKTVKRDAQGKIVKGSAPLNPNGAPKRGDSWAETIKAIFDLDGPEIAAMWDTQHKEFGKLPAGISVKQLVVMTVAASMMREPSPGLWRELMERAEGKVKDQIEHSGEITVIKSYVTLSPDDWDQADSDIRPATVADSAVARQVASSATDG